MYQKRGENCGLWMSDEAKRNGRQLENVIISCLPREIEREEEDEKRREDEDEFEQRVANVFSLSRLESHTFFRLTENRRLLRIVRVTRVMGGQDRKCRVVSAV
jgi:hypothetical protein